MPHILVETGIFSGGDRDESEEFVLHLLGTITLRDKKYLEKHPETPKLYDSGVTYAVPDQMASAKIPDWRMAECKRFLRNCGATDETIEIVISFLHGIEIFRDIPKLFARKEGDCDNLACVRAAELQLAGVKAVPCIIWRDIPGGGRCYHALVRWPDGTSEDPSLILGMGGDDRMFDRAEEKRRNRERYDNFVETARGLVNSGKMTPDEAARKVVALGLVPRDNKW